MYSVALLSEILKLCKHHINFQQSGVFRLAPSDKGFSALKKTLLSEHFLKKTDKHNCLDVWDEISKDDAIKGITFDSHDWASLAKHTFMHSEVLDPDALQAVVAWKLLSSKLKTIFAQIYLSHSMANPGRENQAFNHIEDKMKQVIQQCFLQFLNQLYLTQQFMSFNVIIDFLCMATLVDKGQGNAMDATAIGVVFAPSLLHALNLQEAFLSKPANWLEATANQKLEYQFMACVVSSIIEIPNIGDRKKMVESALSSDLSKKHQFESDQLRAKIWQKTPMHLSAKQEPSKSKKPKKASKKNSNIKLSIPESESEHETEEPVDLTKTLESLSLSPNKRKKNKSSKRKSAHEVETPLETQPAILHRFDASPKSEKFKRSNSERAIKHSRITSTMQ